MTASTKTNLANKFYTALICNDNELVTGILLEIHNLKLNQVQKKSLISNFNKIYMVFKFYRIFKIKFR